jgi:hypothetical protein
MPKEAQGLDGSIELCSCEWLQCIQISMWQGSRRPRIIRWRMLADEKTGVSIAVDSLCIESTERGPETSGIRGRDRCMRPGRNNTRRNK